MTIDIPITGIILDLNGVISTDFQKSLPELHRLIGAACDVDEFARLWWAVYVEASLGHVSPDDFWTRLREVTSAPELPADIEERWLDLIQPTAPDIAAVLARLHERYRLGVLSNHVSRWAHRLLERAGALPHLDAVLISSDAGRRKPDAGLYVRACELAGCAPDTSVYVADEEEDLLAAQSAGMYPVFMPGEEAHCDIGVCIDKLSDLLSLCARQV